VKCWQDLISAGCQYFCHRLCRRSHAFCNRVASTSAIDFVDAVMLSAFVSSVSRHCDMCACWQDLVAAGYQCCHRLCRPVMLSAIVSSVSRLCDLFQLVTSTSGISHAFCSRVNSLQADLFPLAASTSAIDCQYFCHRLCRRNHAFCNRVISLQALALILTCIFCVHVGKI